MKVTATMANGQEDNEMLTHKPYFYAFLAALIAVGIAGEIFGLRVLICSRLDDSFIKKLIAVSATYVVTSWIMALVGVHLLHMYLVGNW